MSVCLSCMRVTYLMASGETTEELANGSSLSLRDPDGDVAVELLPAEECPFRFVRFLRRCFDPDARRPVRPEDLNESLPSLPGDTLCFGDDNDDDDDAPVGTDGNNKSLASSADLVSWFLTRPGDFGFTRPGDLMEFLRDPLRLRRDFGESRSWDTT